MHPRTALACAFLAVLVSGTAAAQSRAVRPYFLVIVDTSGSMSDAVSGAAPTCNGYPSTKIGHAKCALTKIINATGDADFGLMQFSKANNNTDCGNVNSCAPTDAAAWLRVPIETNNTGGILNLIDNVGNGPGDELCAGGYTPLGGVLIAAQEYFQGMLPMDVTMPSGAKYPAPTQGDTALACRPVSVILLTDGDECCDSCTAAWSGCPKTHNAFPSITCPTTCGTSATCTGANQAFENAPDRAYELLTEIGIPNGPPKDGGIHTYAIGFGISPGDAHIEHIATAGGTDNPSDGVGGVRGFYATNEAQLSLALSQIIADAQPPAEKCNNLDDDCDMKIDEGIPKYCDKPHGINDLVLCDPPAETVCDGMDDNCNGLIDEGVHNACGTCGDVPPETCDGMDNDCDGKIDEDIAGGMCGSSKGICMPGTLQCIGGKEQCAGEVGPQPESCNCKDDDCDGFVDEDTDNNLCPDGKCVGCMCIPRCVMTREFMPSCPNGLRPDIQPSGECLCVKDDCNAKQCSASSQTRDDVLACAPNDPTVAPCLCRAGMCVARCDGVGCASDEICQKRTGRCVKNNCIGLGCAQGELCDPTSGDCMKDPCKDASCDADQVCRQGKCEASCATLDCGDGRSCAGGKCVADKCASATCVDGKTCDPGTGKCVDDVCSGKSCGAGMVCAVASGDCERDPCWGVTCPDQQVCKAGQCEAIGNVVKRKVQAGSDPNARVLAAGGGGCSCRVASGRSSSGSQPLGLGFGLGLCLLGLARARARRRRRLALAALALAAGLAGCKVDPFCIDCIDAGKHVRRDGGGDSGNPTPRKDGGGGSGGSDSGAAPLDDADVGGGGPVCMNPVPETCNGKDDDCDYKVDEDAVPDVNDCIQFGICAGTSPICVGGKFECRYPDARQKDETLCDGKDNDCDGAVDENFDLGKACDVGVGACKVTGKLVCNDNANGTRCEVDHSIDPADEICDGLDNDCDGMVDEPRSNPGSSPSFVHDEVVQVRTNLWVYKYEASHADASASDQGIITARACSRAGVLPWTNLTYPEALAACQAADMELCGSCAVGDTCSADDWKGICQGSGNCSFSYTASGTCPGTYPSDASPSNKKACNGADLTAQPGSADDGALAPTGSYPNCFTTEMGGGQVYDLSGNAKEWTTGPSSPGSNPLRGGSYNNQPGGMSCSFDFNLASDQVRLPNVGFRCCSAAQP